MDEKFSERLSITIKAIARAIKKNALKPDCDSRVNIERIAYTPTLKITFIILSRLFFSLRRTFPLALDTSQAKKRPVKDEFRDRSLFL